jgi:hypothetical protein
MSLLAREVFVDSLDYVTESADHVCIQIHFFSQLLGCLLNNSSDLHTLGQFIRDVKAIVLLNKICPYVELVEVVACKTEMQNGLQDRDASAIAC